MKFGVIGEDGVGRKGEQCLYLGQTQGLGMGEENEVSPRG